MTIPMISSTFFSICCKDFNLRNRSYTLSILYLSILLHFYNTIHIKFYIKLFFFFLFPTDGKRKVLCKSLCELHYTLCFTELHAILPRQKSNGLRVLERAEKGPFLCITLSGTWALSHWGTVLPRRANFLLAIQGLYE
jgi:hypothetical protein